MKQVSALFCLLVFFSLSLTAYAESGSRYLAVSDTAMNHEDAVAWCKSKGGRLPKINGVDSLSPDEGAANAVTIDGIGVSGELWPSTGLPRHIYWTGTEFADGLGHPWIVNGVGGKVEIDCYVDRNGQSPNARAVCVP